MAHEPPAGQPASPATDDDLTGWIIGVITRPMEQIAASLSTAGVELIRALDRAYQKGRADERAEQAARVCPPNVIVTSGPAAGAALSPATAASIVDQTHRGRMRV